MSTACMEGILRSVVTNVQEFEFVVNEFELLVNEFEF